MSYRQIDFSSKPAVIAMAQGESVVNTALLHAAQEGDTSGMNDLLAEGAGVNAKTSDGWTPLMLAVINSHMESARMLINKGAEVNAKNDKGWTALRFAVSMNDTEATSLLLSARADVNIQDNEGNTALMQAASENITHCLKFLIENGADVNISNNLGETALMVATRSHYTDVVKLLKEAGATDEPRPTEQPATDNYFDEIELAQLKKEIEEAVSSIGFTSDPVETQALVPTQDAALMERLVNALEWLHSNERPAPRQLMITEISHKLMLTLPEAVALSNLSRNHLIKAIRSSMLKAKKIGRGWRVKRDDLDAYIRDLF